MTAHEGPVDENTRQMRNTTARTSRCTRGAVQASLALILAHALLPAPGLAQAAPSAAAAPGPWRITRSRSEMTDQQNVTVTLRASASIHGKLGPVWPVLIVRCREGELEAFLSTDMVLGSDLDDDSPVRLRWNDLEPVDAIWTISSDHQGVFAQDLLGFVNEGLAVARRLRIEFHPYDSTPRVASFTVRGFAHFIPALRKACPEAGLQTPAETARKDSTYNAAHQEMLSGPAIPPSSDALPWMLDRRTKAFYRSDCEAAAHVPVDACEFYEYEGDVMARGWRSQQEGCR
jgi:hypothetical protein